MAQTSLNSTGVASSGSLVLQSNGTTTAVTIDTAQNLGLGVTPSAWLSSWKALQVGNTASLVWGNDNSSVTVGTNYFFNSTADNKYIASNFATKYQQLSGVHSWHTAASGTAGATATFTQAMTLDASGNWLLGTTTQAGRLTIKGASGSSGFIEVANGSNTPGTNGVVLGQNSDNGAYFWNRYNEFLSFGTNNTERARIDSSGNLIQSAPTTPPSLSTNGTMVFNLTSNTNLRVSVRGSDGVTRTANITLS